MIKISDEISVSFHKDWNMIDIVMKGANGNSTVVLKKKEMLKICDLFNKSQE